ncbi:MAG: serine/threonine-protein kinase [Bryobacteraceae bacterium]
MVGKTISHYQIVEKLGAGGMGEIYKAQDTRLNRFVAIKALSRMDSGDSERRRRFVQEAQAASSLNHPNIITIYDIVSEGGDEFMVMEYVNGKTLGDLLPPGGLGVSDALNDAIQIADALQAAHAAGIVHRDLKPANIMVTGAGLVKVLDFGLAKLTFGARQALASGVASGAASTAAFGADETESVLAASLTTQGSILGTVSYMSPEQAQSKRVDQRSDIFSFGLVLYEMVTGSKAFASDSAISTLSAILRDEARPIAEIVSNVPPELERVVYRALRKDPGERWQSMKELQVELISIKQKLDSGALSAMKPVSPPARKKPALRWIVAAVASLVVCALAAGGWWWMAHSRPAPPSAAPQTAQAPAAAATVPPQPVISPPAPAMPANIVLTNQDVLELAAAKVPTAVIIEHIHSHPNKFDLSTAAIIRLTQAGVPGSVIEAMHRPIGAVKPRPEAPKPAAVQPAVQAATPPPATSSVSERPAPAAPAPSPVTPPAPVDKGRVVQVLDGIPFPISLAEDVSADPKPGQPLRFRAARDVRMGDAVVIASGAAVTGQIVDAAKKKFIGRSKPTYRLIDAVAVDGSHLKLRSAPARHGDTPPDRPLEPIGPSKSKDVLPAGSAFLAYFDGPQTVTVHAPTSKPAAAK